MLGVECRLKRARRKKETIVPSRLPVNAEEFMSLIQKLKSIEERFLTRLNKVVCIALYKKLSILLVIPIIFSIVALGAFIWWDDASRAPTQNPNPKRFVVTKGSNASQIAEKLYKEGLIKTPFAFKIYVQLTGKSDKIQAGQYEVAQNLGLIEVVATLTRSPKEFWVTIPEGLRKEQVVERVVDALGLEKPEAQVFREEFLKESDDQEGFLFPDTYLFPKTASASSVVRKMTETFAKKFNNQIREDLGSKGLDMSDLVTLASLVEKETKTDEERPVVAGILLKRIKSGWALNVDATVQYAIASSKCIVQSAKCEEWWPKITRDDYEFDSPYNTYKFAGLPPGPIANAGLSSLRAVVYSKDSPYWYYLHDSSGNIYYAETLEEHNQNIQKYLK